MNQEFEAVYNSLKDTVYTIAFRYLADKQAAFDVSQDIFIKVYENQKKLPNGNEQKAFIIRMTMNKCLDVLRKNKPMQRMEEGMEIGSAPETGVEEKDEVKFLLSGLNPDQKAAVILREILGHSYEEVAAVCETDIGTVRSRLSRAKDKMRELYLNRETYGY